MKRPGATIKKVQFYRISVHAPGNGFFLKKGSACFFLGFFACFPVRVGYVGIAGMKLFFSRLILLLISPKIRVIKDN